MSKSQKIIISSPLFQTAVNKNIVKKNLIAVKYFRIIVKLEKTK